MADTMLLTFSELEYLLAESTTWLGSRRSLGLRLPEGIGDIRAAGLASLLVRELAESQGTDIRIGHDVVAAAALLDVPRVWVEFLFRSEHRAVAGSFGVDAANGCLLVSAPKPGVFEISSLDPLTGPTEVFVKVVQGVAAELGAVVLVTRPAGAEPELLRVLRTAEDVWTLPPAGSNEAGLSLTENVAMNLVAGLLDRALRAGVADTHAPHA